MFLLHMVFNIWNRRREEFGDTVGSNTWPRDKITIFYCLNKC